MNVIETQGLKVRYGSTEALAGLDLAVGSGSICALLGANGAGKTTAIKTLVNLLRPKAGSARILGVESRRLSPTQFQSIGYVSENQDLPKWLTVRQLLDFCRPLYPQWDRDLEQQLLRVLELPEHRALKHLSRGMLMKAMLAASLAYRPKLLILDEPFTGLDVVVREELVNGLLEVIGAGEWTVLISSHDLEEVERLADTIAYLDAGKLRFSESTESLLARFRRVEGTVRAPAPAAPPEAIGWKCEGSRVSFVEPHYSPGWVAPLPPEGLQVSAMTLREILVALIRNSRMGSERGAA